MEIRRSVMARPNLSVNITVVGRWSLVVQKLANDERPSTNDLLGKETTGGNIPAAVSFPMRSSRSAGGAGVSTRTFGTISFANFADPLANFAVKKLLTAKDAKITRSTLRKPIPRRHSLGNARRLGGRKLDSHYRAWSRGKGFTFQGFKVSRPLGLVQSPLPPAGP